MVWGNQVARDCSLSHVFPRVTAFDFWCNSQVIEEGELYITFRWRKNPVLTTPEGVS